MDTQTALMAATRELGVYWMAASKIMEVALRSATISQKVCTCWDFTLIYSLNGQINLLLTFVGCSLFKC